MCRYSSVTCFAVNKKIDMTRNEEDRIQRFNHPALSEKRIFVREGEHLKSLLSKPSDLFPCYLL